MYATFIFVITLENM